MSAPVAILIAGLCVAGAILYAQPRYAVVASGDHLVTIDRSGRATACSLGLSRFVTAGSSLTTCREIDLR